MLRKWKTPQENEDRWSSHVRRFVPQLRLILATFLIVGMVSFDVFFDSQRIHRSLCVQGALKGRLGRRILCEVETALDGSTSIEEAFPSAEAGGAGGGTPNEYTADPNSQVLTESDSIAFVLTITSCPEDTTQPTDEDDPLNNFYDATMILKDSVCNCTANNPASGSQYNSTMYAVIHPDAVQCDSTGGVRRRLLNYDRVAMLEELGFKVLIWAEPISVDEIPDSNAVLKTQIESDTGIRDLMHLYAYNLTSHPVAVMINYDTLFLNPIDTIISDFMADPSKKSTYLTKDNGEVNYGTVIVKPDKAEFTAILDTFKNTPYDIATGWGGSGVTGLGAEGILTHYYSGDSANSEAVTMDGVMSFSSTPVCGKPWECHYDPTWDAATAAACADSAAAWYTYRNDFETNRWSKTDLVDTTQSTYHTDFFLGYCDSEGNYQSASDFTAPDSTTPVPATPVPATPVPGTSVPATPVPATPAPPPVGSLQDQWLQEHNTRRTAFYNMFPQYSLTDVPLKWSNDVATSAQNYANKLIGIDGCVIQHDYQNDSYGGENLAMNWGSGGSAVSRTPAQVLNGWYEDEIDLNAMELVGQKYHASQVIFRSSKYLGCGSAEKPHNGGTCFIQVCRYIAAGNCFLENLVAQYPSLVSNFPGTCATDYSNKDWLCSVLSDSAASLCSPNLQCPAEGCF